MLHAKPTRAAAPGFEPVTLAQAKAQLRIAVANTDHDDYLTRLIQHSRELVEHDTSLIVATGTFSVTARNFPKTDWIELPLRPVTAITSVTYKDTAGASQTFDAANYSLSNAHAMPRVLLTYNVSWPTTRGYEDDVTITFVAGHASASVVPEVIKQAVLLEIMRQFEMGDKSQDFGFDQLLRRYQRTSYP